MDCRNHDTGCGGLAVVYEEGFGPACEECADELDEAARKEGRVARQWPLSEADATDSTSGTPDSTTGDCEPKRRTSPLCTCGGAPHFDYCPQAWWGPERSRREAAERERDYAGRERDEARAELADVAEDARVGRALAAVLAAVGDADVVISVGPGGTSVETYHEDEGEVEAMEPTLAGALEQVAARLEMGGGAKENTDAP